MGRIGLVCVGLWAWLGSASAWADFAKVQDAPKRDFEVKRCSEGYVQVDGFATDWEQAPALESAALIVGEPDYDWTGPKDLSMKIQLQADAQFLYLAIEVRDNVVVGPKGAKKGDRVELWFDGGEASSPKDRLRMIELGLGEMADGGKPSVRWGQGPGAKGREVEGALRDGAIRVKGNYFFEIGLPLSLLSEPAPGLEPLGMVVIARDWDYDDPNEDEAAISTAPFDGAKNKDVGAMGRLWLKQAAALMGDFEARNPEARGKQATGEGWADVGGDSRREWARLVGRFLLLAGEGLGEGNFYYYTLPWSERHQARSLELQDLTGDGKVEMIVRYTITHEDVRVEQELLAIFHFFSDKVILVMQAEVGNKGPEWEIKNKVQFQGKGKGKPSVIQITQGAPVGQVDIDTYLDVDKDDIASWDRLLLPWQEGRSRTYVWGDSQFLKDE